MGIVKQIKADQSENLNLIIKKAAVVVSQGRKCNALYFVLTKQIFCP